MKMVFYSLQGLGNSIMNFPIFHRLRECADYDVKVVCFNNGSSAFYKAFRAEVVGVSSRKELLRVARRMEVDASFTCYPTWRRELSASYLTPAGNQFILRPFDNFWARWFWDFQAEADPKFHHVENNLRLLSYVPSVKPTYVSMMEALDLPEQTPARVLGVHPTASSEVKYYPIKFWKELLQKFGGEFSEILLFCGASATEFNFCKSIKNQVPEAKITIFSGLGFHELAMRIAGCAHFIGSDSALLHLAAMLGRPCLGLWSFANFRVIYPYGDHVQIMIPRETLTAKTFEYPGAPPAYLARASGKQAFDIYTDAPKPNFTIKPKIANPVRFYTF